MRIVAIGLILLLAWMGGSLAFPGRHSLRDFDGRKVGLLETAMWRDYYEHRSLALFGHLTTLLRDQYGFNLCRSVAGAAYAARAAVVFQKGHSRSDYELALPDLRRYYGMIRATSAEPFDVERAARAELEWWIAHRDRRPDLVHCLSQLQTELYARPEAVFKQHSKARADAMTLRDTKGAAITDADWNQIETLLIQSWTALHAAVA